MPRTTRTAGTTGIVLAAVCLLATSPLIGVASAAPDSPSFRGEPIETLAKYDGQSTCSPSAKPGTTALRSLVLASYDGTGDYGIVRDCEIGGVSEHKEGRAWDWKLDAFDAEQDAAAKDMFEWLLAEDSEGHAHALARRLGVMYMIYNGHIWSSYNADAGWRPYTGANPHTDHVHISLSRIGGDKQVSYWGNYVTPSASPSASPSGTASPRPTPSTSPSTTATSTEAIANRWKALGGASGPLGNPVGSERSVGGGREQGYQGGRILWSAATGARGVWGSINVRYAQLGGPEGTLGLPTTDEVAVRGGRGNSFQGGRILWSQGTGAHGVWGAIGQRYAALGGPDSPLGLPTTDEVDVRGGKATTFQSGRILWSPGTGARGVWGSIGVRYAQLGGPEGVLGLPTTDEIATGKGRGNTFQGGRILWSLPTGTRVVHGSIGERYSALGGPTGPLGLPTTDEVDVKGGRGSTFQGGQILWSPGTGARGVWGSIGQLYGSLGGPDGPLGLPTTDEVAVKNGRGSTFQGGRILWSQSTGTHVVRGSIGERYAALGGPDGPLGLPTTDEVAEGKGRGSSFQGGRILWSAETGTHAVWGSIAQRYNALGGAAGPFGLPTTDELAVKGGRASTFQGGTLYWSSVTGVRALTGPVRSHHDAYGGADGPLGLPVGDLEDVADGIQQQLFAGGRVYLRAGTAHHVRGAIRDRYLELGGPTGSLGLPVSDEYDIPGGKRNDFDNGQLTWTASTGAVTGP